MPMPLAFAPNEELDMPPKRARLDFSSHVAPDIEVGMSNALKHSEYFRKLWIFGSYCMIEFEYYFHEFLPN